MSVSPSRPIPRLLTHGVGGLKETIAGLSTRPRRYSVVPERFRREVRHALYHRPGSQSVYRILFTITGEQESSEDAPTVTILHVRHASSRPITGTLSTRRHKTISKPSLIVLRSTIRHATV